MFCYAQLNEDNICIGISELSGEVNTTNMMLLENYDASLLGKRHNNGIWDDVPQAELPTVEPLEREILQAELLLNQQRMISKQAEQDFVLAELLLNQQGVSR